MARPRESILNLFDPLRLDNGLLSDQGSPTELSLTGFLYSDDHAKPSHVMLTRRLIDVGEATMVDISLQMVEEEGEEDEEGDDDEGIEHEDVGDVTSDTTCPESEKTPTLHGMCPETPKHPLVAIDITPSTPARQSESLFAIAKNVSSPSTSIQNDEAPQVISSSNGFTFNFLPKASQLSAPATSSANPTMVLDQRSVDLLNSFYASIKPSDSSFDILNDDISLGHMKWNVGDGFEDEDEDSEAVQDTAIENGEQAQADLFVNLSTPGTAEQTAHILDTDVISPMTAATHLVMEEVVNIVASLASPEVDAPKTIISKQSVQPVSQGPSDILLDGSFVLESPLESSTPLAHKRSKTTLKFPLRRGEMHVTPQKTIPQVRPPPIHALRIMKRPKRSDRTSPNKSSTSTPAFQNEPIVPAAPVKHRTVVPVSRATESTSSQDKTRRVAATKILESHPGGARRVAISDEASQSKVSRPTASVATATGPRRVVVTEPAVGTRFQTHTRTASSVVAGIKPPSSRYHPDTTAPTTRLPSMPKVGTTLPSKSRLPAPSAGIASKTGPVRPAVGIPRRVVSHSRGGQ